jgi:beta-glucosidase
VDVTRRETLKFAAGVPIALATSLPVFADSDSPLYRDARAPIRLRVRDLLSRMTLEEKVAQMIALWST